MNLAVQLLSDEMREKRHLNANSQGSKIRPQKTPTSHATLRLWAKVLLIQLYSTIRDRTDYRHFRDGRNGKGDYLESQRRLQFGQINQPSSQLKP